MRSYNAVARILREGADGRNTLANANLASRAELTNKIGTPEHRGSRALPFEGDEFGAWETMSSYARDIEAEDYPYIAFGLPGSPTPTINSSSAIASHPLLRPRPHSDTSLWYAPVAGNGDAARHRHR
jgi:hypothetical protein